MTPAGFPHSDICGSKPVCGSPQLFAAYHVLHRRSVPWHPPCALLSLIFLKTNLLLSSLLSLSRLFVLLCFSSMRFSRCALLGYTKLVGWSGLEPPTSRLSGVCSNQLSYQPMFNLVEMIGFEPVTSCLQGRRSPN